MDGVWYVVAWFCIFIFSIIIRLIFTFLLSLFYLLCLFLFLSVIFIFYFSIFCPPHWRVSTKSRGNNRATARYSDKACACGCPSSCHLCLPESTCLLQSGDEVQDQAANGGMCPRFDGAGDVTNLFATPTRVERVGGGDFPKLANQHHSRRSWPCDEARASA